jgi:hypothetical protein
MVPVSVGDDALAAWLLEGTAAAMVADLVL